MKLQLSTLAVVVVLFAGIGCREKGPLEKAADSVSDAAQKTEKSIQEGLDQAGDFAEDAYDKTSKAIDYGMDVISNGVDQAGQAVEEFSEDVKEAVSK